MIMQMPNLPDPASSGKTTNNQNSTNSLNNPSGDAVSLSLGQTQTHSSSSSGLQKEQEPLSIGESAAVMETVTDVEVSPELEQAGVIKRSETIELPPDVKAMGVSAVGPAQPVTYTGVVQLPLTDDQIMVGLHAQIISSLRWLAEWCVRILKQAHIHLRKISGKVVREKEN